MNPEVGGQCPSHYKEWVHQLSGEQRFPLMHAFLPEKLGRIDFSALMLKCVGLKPLLLYVSLKHSFHL